MFELSFTYTGLSITELSVSRVRDSREEKKPCSLVLFHARSRGRKECGCNVKYEKESLG